MSLRWSGQLKKEQGGKNDIRQRAEAQLAGLGEQEPELSPDDTRKLIHELRIHQIELEMQNEELRKTELELSEARDRFIELYDFSPVGYASISAEGIIMQANLTLARLLGVERSRLIKKSFPSFIAGEDQDKYYLYGKSAFTAKHQNHSIGIRLKKTDKSIFWVALQTTVKKDKDTGCDGLFLSIMEITERKTAEAILEKFQSAARKTAKGLLESSEAHALNVIANARDAFIVMDAQGNIIDWNPEAVSMFGFTKKEAIGRNLADTIIPAKFRKAHTAGLKHYVETGEHKALNKLMEISALHKNGNTLSVELSIVPLREDDSVTFNAFIRDLTERNADREKLVRSAKSLRKSLIGTVLAIAKAVEARDPYTAGHQQQVSHLARSLAQEMRLDKDVVEGIRMGAFIHDIGKIQLPAEILSKPGRVTDLEYLMVQTHCQVGYDILQDVEFPWPVADIVYQHHERMDGSGYPQGLKGDEISLQARIVAVADVVEAISSHRPYRAGLGLEAALDEIRKQRGKFYDPVVVDACLKLFAEKRFAFTT